MPRFERPKPIFGRLLGPDSYRPKNPVRPDVTVRDPTRKSSVFRSTTEQRLSVATARTDEFVSPGSYEPSFSYVYRDMKRPDAMFFKKSSQFASQTQRFEPARGQIDVPDTRWSLRKDSCDWTKNRHGGGYWNRAERDSGTLAAYSRSVVSEVVDEKGTPEEAPESPEAHKHAAMSLDFHYRGLTSVKELLTATPQATTFSGLRARGLRARNCTPAARPRRQPHARVLVAGARPWRSALCAVRARV